MIFPRVTRRGVRFIASWEGFSPMAVNIGDGAWTIGYGTTSAVRPVEQGMGPIDRGTARRWLRDGLEDLIVPSIPRARSLRACEVDALASFGYNLGPGRLQPGGSTLANRLRSSEGKTYEARKTIYQQELGKWVSPGTPFEAGLRRRRAYEILLACDGRYFINE